MPLHEVSVTSQPSKRAVDITDVKSYIRVSKGFTEDDADINAFVDAATDKVERYTGRALITQTRKALWQNYTYKVHLPYPPIQSITTVKTILLDDTDTLTVNSDYYVQGIERKYLRVTNVDSPTTLSPTDPLKATRDLEVEYVCGYGDTHSSVPRLLSTLSRLW